MPTDMNEIRQMKRLAIIEIATSSLMWPTTLILKWWYPESISWAAALLVPLVAVSLLSLQLLLIAWLKKRVENASEKS